MSLIKKNSYDVEFKIVSTLALARIKRSVVASLFLPSTMKIVSHDVDEVQILGYLSNIVGQRGRTLSGGDGSTKDESMLLECLFELLRQQHEVLDVFWFAATLIRILPIQIETVKFIFQHEVHGILDKFRAKSRIGDDRGISGRSLVPSADGNERFSFRAPLAKLVKSAKSVFAPIIREILPRVQNSDVSLLADADKGVDKMSAKIRLNVRYVKFAVSWSVNSPATEVAHDLLCEIKRVVIFMLNVVRRTIFQLINTHCPILRPRPQQSQPRKGVSNDSSAN